MRKKRPATKRRRPERRGRPPTGVRPGERLSDYRMVIVRLPPETVAQLQDLANTLQMPQWRVMTEAIQTLAASRLPAEL